MLSDNQDSGALSTIFALAATVDARDILTTTIPNKCMNMPSPSVKDSDWIIWRLTAWVLVLCYMILVRLASAMKYLNKKEALTEKEWEIIKSHPQLGAAIVSHSIQLSPCVQGILHHHEKFNGEGYPDGLKGEEIPLESRILAIADSFAAMTSARVYSRTFDYDAAIEEIKNGAGKQFDPKLVEVFLTVIPKTIEYLKQSQDR